MKQHLRYVADANGHAAAEFALLVPVILLLLVGCLDLGLSVQKRLLVEASTTTGLQHVLATQGTAVALTREVIAHELGNTPAIIEVERYCECSSSKVACTAPCSSNKTSFVYANVQVTSTHVLWPDIVLSSYFRVYTGKVS